MKLQFINVGYGEAILLTAKKPNGTDFHMLIDGGSGEDTEYAGHPARVRAADFIKEQGITRIDVLFNTHIHEDHTCGLYRVAQEFEIGEYWCCSLPDCSETWEMLQRDIVTVPSSDKCLRALNTHCELLQQFRSSGVPIRQLKQGVELHLAALGLSVEVLGPSSQEVEEMFARFERLYQETDTQEKKLHLLEVDRTMNNHSGMLMLNYCGTRILLPGDTNFAGYSHLSPETLRADIFKVGHHGQRDGANEALAAAVSPRVIVVCASSDRRYESMHPEILSLFVNHNPNTNYLLSDTPDLAPWTNGIPAHRASELTVLEDGSVKTAYLPL